MCFSAKVSFITLTLGLVTSFICILLGSVTDKIVGYFFAFVSLMQVIEYLLWKHQICDNYNRFLSIMGMILNHLQPVILAIVMLIFYKNNPNKKWIFVVVFIYLCVIIPYSQQFINNKKLQCTIKDVKSKHLTWIWNDMKNYTISYFVFVLTACVLFLLGLPNIKMAILSIIVTIFTLTTTTFYYKDHVGALWCYYVVFIPTIYIICRVLFNFDPDKHPFKFIHDIIKTI